MNITFEVPDSIMQSLHLPEGEVEDRFRCELALSLYTQGILLFGKATELSGISRWHFAEFVGSRGVARHYGSEELAEDVAYGSYASADRPRVKPLVNELHRRGWSVWWDRTIRPGKSWDEVIEAALDNSRRVIVLWSHESVRSDSVRGFSATDHLFCNIRLR